MIDSRRDRAVNLGGPHAGERFFQCARDEEISVAEEVAQGVAGVAHQASQVGFVPAAAVHVGGEAAVEAEPLVGGFGHGQHGRGHAVIAFDDREGMAVAEADQQHGVGHFGVAEVTGNVSELFQKTAFFSASQFGVDATDHLTQIETFGGKASPVVAGERSQTP